VNFFLRVAGYGGKDQNPRQTRHRARVAHYSTFPARAQQKRSTIACAIRSAMT
jgi:hypothetical protein